VIRGGGVVGEGEGGREGEGEGGMAREDEVWEERKVQGGKVSLRGKRYEDQ